MKIQKLITIYFLLSTILISFCNSYLIIPFKIKKPTIKTKSNLINASKYLEYIKNSQLTTNIYMGTPEKEIEIYLTMETYDFFLGKGFCLQNPNSPYNPSFSSTYKNEAYITIFSPLFSNGTQSKDNFIFYNNLSLTQNNSI